MESDDSEDSQFPYHVEINLPELSESQMKGLIDAALEISRQRRDILICLRDALLNERNDEALKFARQYCGIEDWQMKEQIEKRAKQITKKQRARERQARKRR
jgi:hypothetical protein